MPLKKQKPTTQSQRHLIRIDKNVTKNPLLKKQIVGKKNQSGRNHSGKITVFHKGGGVKNRYRKINFSRTENSTGIICSIEYDPNRNALISSVFDLTKKEFYYILSPQGIQVSTIIKSGLGIKPDLGNSLPIYNIPEGIPIHNISPKTFKKSQISRSAGTFSTIIEKTDTFALIQLSSGEQRYVSTNCYANIGRVSNKQHYLTKLGKAGRSRWLNRRPTVRGVAMNPIDHPHGGGEGKKSGKSLTPWGQPNSKGKTSKSTNKLILKRN